MFIREFAPAKVNLYLHVVGYRKDGYHMLDSLVTFTNIGDFITIEPASSLIFHISGPFRSQLDKSNNIVLKAIYLLSEATGYTPNIAITLNKYLPVAAGLGGGSADAAATLRGLLRLWKTNMPEEKLTNLATRLGADVLMCLYNKPIHISGIGEELKIMPHFPPFWLVLVNPFCTLETKAVFASYRRQSSKSYYSTMLPATLPSIDSAGFIHTLAMCRNDLEETAATIKPVISSVLEELSLLPGCVLARMSGSGPTCFGLFYSQKEAQVGIYTLSSKKKLWWHVVTAPLRV